MGWTEKCNSAGFTSCVGTSHGGSSKSPGSLRKQEEISLRPTDRWSVHAFTSPRGPGEGRKTKYTHTHPHRRHTLLSGVATASEGATCARFGPVESYLVFLALLKLDWGLHCAGLRSPIKTLAKKPRNCVPKAQALNKRHCVTICFTRFRRQTGREAVGAFSRLMPDTAAL